MPWQGPEANVLNTVKYYMLPSDGEMILKVVDGYGSLLVPPEYSILVYLVLGMHIHVFCLQMTTTFEFGDVYSSHKYSSLSNKI